MITTHPQMLDEILETVNNNADDAADVKKALLEAYKTPYVRFYMMLGVSNEWMPEEVMDTPTKDYGYHRSLAGRILLNRHTVNIIDQIIINQDILIKPKKEQYSTVCEMLYSGECIALKSLLNKNLSSVYPNITHDIVVESLA